MSITGNRLNADIDKMFQNGMLEQFIDDIVEDTHIDNDIAKILYNYQIVHLGKMLRAVSKNQVSLDGSDTGTGKTYCAIGLCRQLKKRPFIICPKSVISTWVHVCKLFKVNPFAIVNYETIQNCKWYDIKKIYELKGEQCPYLSEKDNEYVWKSPPDDVILLFDESHRCKNRKTNNGKLLLSSVQPSMKKIKKILLSATIADTVYNFASFGYLLGLYPNIKKSKAWIDDLLRKSKNTGVNCIYDEIYPHKGSRMLIQEIDEFPKSQISAEVYAIDKSALVNKLGVKLKRFQSDPKYRSLSEVVKILQQIEKIKIPIIADIVTDMLNAGLHVVVFLNYLDSIHSLAKLFKKSQILIGETTIANREIIINNFQKDKISLLIVSRKLQEGVSFHDLNGKYPRGTVISPNYSSQDLIQTIGRVARAGAKTKSIQRIVFVANSFEEGIANRVTDKLKFNQNINGADFEIKI